MKMQHPIHFLWLLPEMASSARFYRLIEDLSARIGAAPFEPHVTLLGSLCAAPADSVGRARRLAERISPFSIAVERAAHSDAYFRCVYFVATPDGALSRTRTEAEQTFGCPPPPTPFFPHLSLVYGTLPPATRRQLVAAADLAQPAPFIVDRLQLVESAPDYRDWQTIGTFALGGT